MQAKNEIGNKYNFLTVIAEGAEYSKYGKTWLCKCECGKETTRLGVDIRRGHFQSCGCKQGYNGGPKRVKHNRAVGQHFSHYKCSKRAKELGFHLNIEEFEEICRKNCHYCGKPPQTRRAWYGSTRNGPAYQEDQLSGLDRFNNNTGYTLENSVPCCSLCNIMKNNLTTEDFIQHVKAIVSYQLNNT